MAPLQKAASRRSDRRNQSHQDEPTQQHGRTSSNLAAEAAAHALRTRDGSRSLATLARSPAPAKNQSRGAIPGSQTGAPDGPRPSTPLPLPRRPSSYAPAVSSPLNPSSPTASLHSGDSMSSSDGRRSPEDQSPSPASSAQAGHHANPAILPRSQSTNALEIVSDHSRSPMARPSRGRRPFSEIHPVRTQQSSPSLRPQAPMTLNDLGRDFSRYPIRGPRHSDSESSSDLPPPPVLNVGASAGESSRSSSAHPSNPFIAPSAQISQGGDPEKSLFFMDDRLSAPTPYYAGFKFPMFLDEKEVDDDMHMPQPDDDIQYRVKFRDYLNRDGLISMLSLAILIAALVGVFVILPVLTFAGVYTGPVDRPEDTPDPSDFVTDQKFPLLQNIRRGLIDSSTPDSAMTRSAANGDTLRLVWSDEFNEDGRTFHPEDDPYWTAPNIWYGATQDLEWYDPDAATTAGGTLALKLEQFPNHNLIYRSGMLNSWNQLCFKGGALEVSLSLPGPAGAPGLWPGVWTMGNLGRPGYMASTEGVWPFTYNQCDVGITPNQSSPDGISYQPGQKLPSCTCPGEDHPSPGTGRGAPEIDVIEAGVDPLNRIGIVTQSFQVAPYDIWYQPDYEFMAIPNEDTTQMNSYRGGPYQQAISGTTLLNNDWYDQEQFQKYAFEYTPGNQDGEITWFVGDDVAYAMSGKAIGPNGNVGQREISQEPMSVVLNLGLSNSWTWIDWANLTFPTTMYVDYVRVYQKEGEESITCDPPGYETTEYIKNHPKAYNNPNLTVRLSYSLR
ncbi:MAG: hypothetical protein M1837_006881 [Sclerophora amabilis]|nr:MAG: hypothetical protein M1837_006881 [Sclerophora amabilis]